jgi:Subtilase family
MRPLLRHSAGLSIALLALIGLVQGQAGSASPAAGELQWRFSVKANTKASSTITAHNICRRPHEFEVVTQDLPVFMRLLAEPAFQVQPRTDHLFPVQFDATGLSPGLHEARVVIKCLTCHNEKTCSQDFQTLHIYMTVEAAPQIFESSRVLVTIRRGSEDMQATASSLAMAYGMKVEDISELDSLKSALIAYSLPAGADVLAKVAELESHSLTAQPDFLYSASALGQATEVPLPPAQLQYGPKLIRVDRLRGSLTGKGVKVALIDTGVDANHPSLQGRIVMQTDVTGRGFTADAHGTMLAGIIAATARGGTGIAGIAPDAEILSVKACHPLAPQGLPAQCWSGTLAKGLDFAIAKKVALINMSLGGPGGVEDKLLKQMVDAAAGRGMVVVAAAGNDGPQGKPGFPAALPNVVAVTAVDSQEQLYAIATTGDFVDLAAPGVEILSTSPGGKYLVSSGTSLAAAFVSGIAALVLEQQPGISPQALQSLLERTAKHLGRPGKDPQFGSGLVDACAAVAELRGNRNLCH